jgi:hypothetical protein
MWCNSSGLQAGAGAMLPHLRLKLAVAAASETLAELRHMQVECQ